MKEYKVKVFEDCTEWYNLKGQLHREDGPAVELANGSKYWYINDQRHREDGPAVEWANGIKQWYIQDKSYTEEEFNNQINKSSCCEGNYNFCPNCGVKLK